MDITRITVLPHEDIVKEIELASLHYHVVDHPGNGNDLLPPRGYFPARAVVDVDRLAHAATRAHKEIIALRRTRDDLQEANNRYLERARAAEAEISRRDEKTKSAKQRVQDILRDKVTASSDLADTIAELGKFVDMIEARAMAVDGPVTPFCEELHAASDLEKSQFQAILSKLYKFRNAWAKKPLVTKEWVKCKAALEGDHDCTTGARPIGWRCFHCDEYFTSENSARLHFGATDGDLPACRIKAGAEGSMLEALIRRDHEGDRDPLFHQKVAQQLRELGMSMKLNGLEIVRVRRWRINASELIVGPGSEFPSADVVAEKLRDEVPLALAGADAFFGGLPL